MVILWKRIRGANVAYTQETSRRSEMHGFDSVADGLAMQLCYPAGCSAGSKGGANAFGLAVGPPYQMEVTAGVAFPNLC